MAQAGRLQRTLARPSVPVRALALHSGAKAKLRLLPAPPDSGIAFVRTDVEPHTPIRTQAESVTDTLLATTLSHDGCEVSTIEHLLCALCLCGVDNAVVELDGSEVPIMDGSARPFVLLLHDTGLVEQDSVKRFIRVKRKVEVELADNHSRVRRASFAPQDTVSWETHIDYLNPVVNRTEKICRVELGDHRQAVDSVAGARTFGFVKDLDFMRSHKRALGGSLNNAVVLDGDRILNEEGLRQPNEFVAHKLLDVIGDCYIEGRLVLGRYQGWMSGHQLNNALMRKLLASEDAWELASADQLDERQMPDFGPLKAPPLDALLTSVSGQVRTERRKAA